MSCKADLLTLSAKMNCLAVPSKSRVFLLPPFLQSETAPGKAVLQHLLLLGSAGLVLQEEAAPLHPAAFVSPTGIMASHCRGRGRLLGCLLGWRYCNEELSFPPHFISIQAAGYLNAQCT